MKRMAAIVGGVVAAWPAWAAAQIEAQDPMEAQRCVWRCLADSNGAEDPAYSACVESKCNAPLAEGGDDIAVGPGPWTMGTTADGLGLYTAMVDPGTANTLYYICDRSGAGYLLLMGAVEGPSGSLVVQIGATPYPLWFEAQNGGYYASTPRDNPVIALMARGGMVQILNGAGYVLGTYSTPMQGNAVAETDRRCRD